MNRLSSIHHEIKDVLSRIERLEKLIQLHERQPLVDTLAVEGYERLRRQYNVQLEDLLIALKSRRTSI